MFFKEFNLVEGFVLDWMYGVCFGLIKNLFVFWFNGEYKSKDFYIGNKVYIYNDVIQFWFNMEFYNMLEQFNFIWFILYYEIQYLVYMLNLIVNQFKLLMVCECKV